jgi:hypothetical protein
MCLIENNKLNKKNKNFILTRTQRHSGSNEGNAPYAGQMHRDVKASF